MAVKKVGDQVESFRVLREIGRGAASVIYLVQDPKSKQIWALKHVEKNNDKDQRFLDQAESEYRIAAEFDHLSIRKVDKLIKKRNLLEVKELFLVMEFVDGISEDRHPPRTFERAVNIFHQIAGAMAHMHDRGFVHADMKPNNIMVTDKGIAKIIDLGQSCRIGTVKERIQGTPDYIAPEQVHRRPINAKTDVYNLGATMYWTFTRQHIPTALAKETSLIGSVDDHLIERPTPAIELNPRIHPKLNELIMQCVEIDPDKRPQSMHWVADRLNLIHGIIRAETERATANGKVPPAA